MQKVCFISIFLSSLTTTVDSNDFCHQNHTTANKLSAPIGFSVGGLHICIVLFLEFNNRQWNLICRVITEWLLYQPWIRPQTCCTINNPKRRAKIFAAGKQTDGNQSETDL